MRWIVMLCLIFSCGRKDIQKEEVKHSELTTSRLEKTRNIYKDNPRNESFSQSFEQVRSRTPAKQPNGK